MLSGRLLKTTFLCFTISLSAYSINKSQVIAPKESGQAGSFGTSAFLSAGFAQDKPLDFALDKFIKADS